MSDIIIATENSLGNFELFNEDGTPCETLPSYYPQVWPIENGDVGRSSAHHIHENGLTLCPTEFQFIRYLVSIDDTIFAH